MNAAEQAHRNHTTPDAVAAVPLPPIVYLQQTRTLHSKYMVVDGKYGWIGSYNIHPTLQSL